MIYFFSIIGVSILFVVSTGCVPVMLARFATEQFCVDPQFARTHDLRFNKPTTKTKAVLFIENHIDSPYRVGFFEAVKNCGAFSEVVEAINENDIAKYPGCDVIRIRMTFLGTAHQPVENCLKYQVAIRFEFKSPPVLAEYNYNSATWLITFDRNGKPPTNESHPLMDSSEQEAKLFAQELVLAACSEMQRSGHYFQ